MEESINLFSVLLLLYKMKTSNKRLHMIAMIYIVMRKAMCFFFIKKFSVERLISFLVSILK